MGTRYVLRTEIAYVRRITPATSSDCWLQYSSVGSGLPTFMLFSPDVPRAERTLANRTGRVGLINWDRRGSHIFGSGSDAFWSRLSNRTFRETKFIPDVGTALMAAYLMFAVKSSPNQPVTVQPFFYAPAATVDEHEKRSAWYRRFGFMDISHSDSETKKCLAHERKTCNLDKKDKEYMILPIKQLQDTPFYYRLFGPFYRTKTNEIYYTLWDTRERGKSRQLCRVPTDLAKMLLGGSPLEPASEARHPPHDPLL